MILADDIKTDAIRNIINASISCIALFALDNIPKPEKIIKAPKTINTYFILSPKY